MYKVVYVSSPVSPVEEILVQGDNRADAYVNACIKLGPNYGPIGGEGAILDVFLIEN
jgi:hypothetical protein